MTVASAVGFLALLQEPNPLTQANALRALESMVNYNWHEIADSIDILVGMARSDKFPERKLAALITSKLYFHLGVLDKSVSFALMAGDQFRLDTDDNDYVDIILAKAVDKYIEARKSSYPSTERFAEPELSLLEVMVEHLVERCLKLEEYIQVIGIGMESRRLDILEMALKAPKLEDQTLALMYYVVEASSKLPFQFQQDVLKFSISYLTSCSSPDFVAIADCMVVLSDSAGLIDLLQKLTNSNNISVALQVCFNIGDNASNEIKEAIMTEFKSAQLLHDAVSGDASNLLRLHLLSKSIASDLLILERTRTQFNPCNSMFHSAVSLANGILHSGTTNDEFLRKNMDWLSAASNWCKYTAVSALGSIYRGHRAQSKNILSQYLPKPGVANSEFSEGGALFALGLIHCGFSQDRWVSDYLLDVLKGADASAEVLQHGCCFGIGAAGLGSAREDAVEEVKAALFSDSAIVGEAAATALGLLKFGSGDMDLVHELLSYARDTKHDKITRSLCVAIGMILFGHASDGLALATDLLADQEGWMRFCACWMLALSLAGSGHRTALQLLLRAAVTDANQDVRRVAVIAMSFVLIGRSSELPEMVRLLLESYNPNLRFGALLALGIGFAGSGDANVLEMIDGLMRSDKTDYVRQAAMLSASLILMEQSEKAQSPLRQHLERVVGSKHEDALAKFGAVLSQGILDAGGRNQCVVLVSPSGFVDPTSVAGMALFCQFWFWYPNINFLSLSLRPTALIAVTADLKAPLFNVTCDAKPSLYAYPTPIKGEKDVAPVKLVTAVLSTATGSPQMDVEEQPETEPKGSKKGEDVEMEADSFAIANFSRATASQAKFVHFDGRFRPLSRFHPRAITVVIDTLPDQPVEHIELTHSIVVDASTEK